MMTTSPDQALLANTPLAQTLAALKELAATPLSSATAMPKDMYVSADVYQLERERLFHREWICAGRSDEIPNTGDYMSFDLCDQPLILCARRWRRYSRYVKHLPAPHDAAG